MGLWVPTQGSQWAFRCPANGAAFSFSSFPADSSSPLVSSRRLCLSMSFRDWCGPFGASEGLPNSLAVPPKALHFSLWAPRALRLPFGAPQSPPCAFRCPARALCLPLGTQHGPVRALGCHPEPSLLSHPGLALSNKSSTAALFCRIASLFDCCSSCSNAVKVVVASRVFASVQATFVRWRLAPRASAGTLTNGRLKATASALLNRFTFESHSSGRA